MAMTKDKWVEEIEGMSVLDLSELVKAPARRSSASRLLQPHPPQQLLPPAAAVPPRPPRSRPSST